MGRHAKLSPYSRAYSRREREWSALVSSRTRVITLLSRQAQLRGPALFARTKLICPSDLDRPAGPAVTVQLVSHKQPARFATFILSILMSFCVLRHSETRCHSHSAITSHRRTLEAPASPPSQLCDTHRRIRVSTPSVSDAICWQDPAATCNAVSTTKTRTRCAFQHGIQSCRAVRLRLLAARLPPSDVPVPPLPPAIHRPRAF